MGVERTHGKSAHMGKVPSSRGRKEAGKRSVGVHKKGGTGAGPAAQVVGAPSS